MNRPNEEIKRSKIKNNTHNVIVRHNMKHWIIIRFAIKRERTFEEQYESARAESVDNV